MGTGILLLRLAVGLTLAAHGAQKLFGWFGGPGIDATGQFMQTIGYYPGRRHALLAGSAEALGGILIAIGFLTPLGAALGLSVMFVGAVTVHLKNGFFATNGGYEYALIVGVAAVAVGFTGPGALSLDALLGYSMSGVVWGSGGLLVGLLGGVFQLAQRHFPHS